MRKLIFILTAALLSSLPALAENELNLRKGEISPNFTAQDTLGNNISLSDFKGKYVVLDFWASWCPDCRKEIPMLKKLYNKYRHTTLGQTKARVEFLGVSFDHVADSWKALLRKEKLAWPQISNGIPWKKNMNPIAQAYKLRWIPTFYVIDPEGKIIGGAITAQDLEKILKSQK